jgi:hypothetical protein
MCRLVPVASSALVGLLLCGSPWAQEVQGPKYGRSYSYEVWGTSSSEPGRERPWSEPFDTPAAAADRLAEIRRDHAPGGLLESSPDKPQGLHIKKSPRGGSFARSADDLTKAARDRAVTHQADYLPDDDGTKCSALVRDLARSLLGRALPELEGNANRQYDALKKSLDVETLWSPDGHQADLAAARKSLSEARDLADAIRTANKAGDTALAAALEAKLDTARGIARDHLVGLSQALETAQELADQGEPVVIAWKNPTGGHGHDAFVVPSPSDGPALTPSGDWAGLRVPSIAQAGSDVFASKPLSYGFRSVETVEGLAIFVLPGR